MTDRNNIQIDLIKLAKGDRLLRLSNAQTGLSLERKLDPRKSVVSQKGKLLGVFKAALAQAEMVAA